MNKFILPYPIFGSMALVIACHAIFQATSIANAESSQPPNIVYILADDMGYGDVSVLNPESKFKTPNLDQMADEGMIFTDAHSNSSVCTPTRYGILTGRYCWRTSLKKAVLRSYDNSIMDRSRLTVASYLKQHGYSTAMVGKWHLGIDWPSKSDPNKITSAEKAVDFTKPFAKGPVDMGFDYFFGINASLDMPPYTFLKNNMAITIPTEMVGRRMFGANGLGHKDARPDEFMPAFTKEAVAYIEVQDPKRPFFLYFPLSAPHTPIASSAPFRGKSGLQGKLGHYANFCLEVDDAVGQVMAALDKKGLSDNTIVIFTADNGCAYYIGVSEFEKGGHYPSGKFTGYKGGAHEGGHRVPFLVKWPKVIKPKTKNDQPICTTDLMATCAEILGKPLPENAGEDSLSFLSAMHGKPIDMSKREAIVHHDIEGNFGIRKGKWKFMELATPGIGAPSPDGTPISQRKGHLYDMEADPGEKHNLASEHPEIVKELMDLLEKYKSDGRSVQSP